MNFEKLSATEIVLQIFLEYIEDPEQYDIGAEWEGSKIRIYYSQKDSIDNYSYVLDLNDPNSIPKFMIELDKLPSLNE